MGYLIGDIFLNLCYHKNLIYTMLQSSGKVTDRYFFVHLSSILVNASRINMLIINSSLSCFSFRSYRLVFSFVMLALFWNWC